MTPAEKQSMLLTQLVALFQATALQQMGKLKNPITDEVARDLNQAKISIDMLEMLEARMKGNLTPEEERMFASVLRDLRLNYVDEANKANKAAPPDSAATPGEPS